MDGSHDDTTHPVEAADAPEGPQVPPLTAFAERHRFVLGNILGAVFAVGTVLALLYTRPEPVLPGFFGVVQQFAFPLMTALIAAVGFTWGWRLPRRWPNLAAYLAIGTYLLYLATGWIYEQFVA